MRIGYNVSRSKVTHNSTSVTFTVTLFTQNRWHYDDNQKMTFSSKLGGTLSFHNGSGSNSKQPGPAVKRTTRKYTFKYPSGSYGKSYTRKTGRIQVTNTYNGSSPTAAITYNIPARPFAKPKAPSNFRVTSYNNSRIQLHWTGHGTTGAPYTSQRIEYDYLDDNGNRRGYKFLTNVGKNSTSYAFNGVEKDQKYYFRIRSNNKAGSSGWRYLNDDSTYPNTEPAAPSDLRAETSTSDTNKINLTWTNNHRWTDTNVIKLFVERRDEEGGDWHEVKGKLETTTESWTDDDPHGGFNQYRVKAKVDNYKDKYNLSSDWTVSNEISTIVPPDPPTHLKPDSDDEPPDFTEDVTLEWQHEHGGDYAPQSHVTIEYSDDDGDEWHTLVEDEETSDEHYTLSADTLDNETEYLWRVKTQGNTEEDFSDWSDSALTTGYTRPTVTLEEGKPGSEVGTFPLDVEWIYNQDEQKDQVRWELELWTRDENDERDDLVEDHSGDNNDTTYTLTTVLDNDTRYQLRVRAQSSKDQWSNWDEQDFIVDLLPPAPVVIEPTYDVGTGTMVLDISQGISRDENANAAVNPSFEDPDEHEEIAHNRATVPQGWDGDTIDDPWEMNWKDGNGEVETNNYGYAEGDVPVRFVTVTELPGEDSDDPFLNLTPRPIEVEGGEDGIAVSLDVSTSYEDDRVRFAAVWRDEDEDEIETIREDEWHETAQSVTDPSRLTWELPDAPDDAATLEIMLEIQYGDIDEEDDPDDEDATARETRASRLLISDDADGIFFDGDTAPDEDYLVSWDDPEEVNTSASTMEIIPAEEYEGGEGRRAMQSQEWAADRHYSLAIKRTGSVNDAAQGVAAFEFTEENRQEHWTIFATCQIPDDYDASEDTDTSRALYIEGTDVIEQASSEGGEHELRITVGPDDFDGDATLRLGGGGTEQQTVRWDALGIVQEEDFEGGWDDVQESAPLKSFDVQRRIDNGTWITILEDVDAQSGDETQSVMDLLPTTTGLNEYRLKSYSEAPSVGYSEVYEKKVGPTGNKGLLFVNYGSVFQHVLRVCADVKEDEDYKQAGQMVPMLGRRWPISQTGRQLTREVSIDAYLVHDAIEFPTITRGTERPSSPPEDWREAARNSETVCLRTPLGTRMYGRLSDLNFSSELVDTADLSFSIEQNDYDETREELGGVEA